MVQCSWWQDSRRRGLVQKPDKKKAFYEITEKGRDYLENPPEEIEGRELERSTEINHMRLCLKPE